MIRRLRDEGVVVIPESRGATPKGKIAAFPIEEPS